MRLLAFLVCATCLAPLVAQETAPDKATIAYVQKLQTSTGGFLSVEPKPNVRLAPTLRSTSAAVRALKYLTAEIPDPDACKKYVASCFDPATGGVSDMPGGKPDVFTTSVGIMAVAELKMPLDKYGKPVVDYLAKHVQTFDDIRIAVAGLERIHKESPRHDRWLHDVNRLTIPETGDPGSGVARDAASILVTRMRLGWDFKYTDPMVKLLQSGQRKDGGFGKDKVEGSDLETTYRVMRAFVMLKSKPRDTASIRGFVARCRNADGGYGMMPGDGSTVGSTYFAAIIVHWLNEMK